MSPAMHMLPATLGKYLPSELIHCVDINLCHSDLFPSQTKLKVIGHHHTYICPTQM